VSDYRNTSDPRGTQNTGSPGVGVYNTATAGKRERGLSAVPIIIAALVVLAIIALLTLGPAEDAGQSVAPGTGTTTTAPADAGAGAGTTPSTAAPDAGGTTGGAAAPGATAPGATGGAAGGTAPAPTQQ